MHSLFASKLHVIGGSRKRFDIFRALGINVMGLNLNILKVVSIMEKTLCIIKPDGVKRNLTGKILAKIQSSGLHFAAGKLIHFSRAQAEAFYAVHAQRPFFQELCEYMTSGPVFVCVLEGENAVLKYRTLMGATDPKKADANTIRAEFGVSIGENTVHGSDSVENAKTEIALLFSGSEIVNSSL
jgi:nucleoside-diphosphate kinase